MIIILMRCLGWDFTISISSHLGRVTSEESAEQNFTRIPSLTQRSWARTNLLCIRWSSFTWFFYEEAAISMNLGPPKARPSQLIERYTHDKIPRFFISWEYFALPRPRFSRTSFPFLTIARAPIRGKSFKFPLRDHIVILRVVILLVIYIGKQQQTNDLPQPTLLLPKCHITEFCHYKRLDCPFNWASNF